MRTSTDSPGRHSRPTDRHRPSTGKPLTPDRTPGRLAPMTIARFDRWLTVRDQIRERYLEVPFDVPATAGSIEVRLEVADPAAVIDLGCMAPSRWCGWSGGARRRFVVRPEQATPGFLPGLEAGTWQVVLGLHQLPADGVQVQVEIELDGSGEVGRSEERRVGEEERGGWEGAGEHKTRA